MTKMAEALIFVGCRVIFTGRYYSYKWLRFLLGCFPVGIELAMKSFYFDGPETNPSIGIDSDHSLLSFVTIACSVTVRVLQQRVNGSLWQHLHLQKMASP